MEPISDRARAGIDTQVTGDGRVTTNMKKTKSGSKEGEGGDSPSRLIDARIKELGAWRGEFGVFHELGYN